MTVAPAATPAAGARTTASPRPAADRLGDVTPRPVVLEAIVAAVVVVAVLSWGVEAALPWHLRALVCPALVVGVALLVTDGTWFRRVAFDPLLALIVVLVPLSAALSTSDQAVVRLAATVAGATTAAFVAASIVPPQRLLRGVTVLVGALVLAVLVHALVAPADAYAPAPGEPESLGLRSFFWQKNSLGLTMVMAVALTAVVDGRRARWAARGAVFAVLLLSRSATALVAAVAVLVVQSLVVQIATGRRAGRQGVTFLVLTLLGSVAVALFTVRERVFRLLGKSSDLTGRDEIWASTWRGAQDELTFGHGFGVFWSETSPYRAEIQRIVGWQVVGPHQGALEVVTDLGLAGLVLFVAAYLLAVSRLAQRVLDGQVGAPEVVCVGLLLTVLVSSVTEATLVVPGLPVLALVTGVLLNGRLAVTTDRRRRSLT